MMQQNNVITIYKDEKAELHLEARDGLPFLHCYINEWTRRDYLDFLTKWVDIQDYLKAEGVDYLFTWSPNEKSAKFARMFGFTTILTDDAGQSLSFMRY